MFQGPLRLRKWLKGGAQNYASRLTPTSMTSAIGLPSCGASFVAPGALRPDVADHYAAAQRSLAVWQTEAEAPTLSEHGIQRARGAIERDCLLEVSFSVRAEPAVAQAEAEPLEEQCG